MFNWSAAFALWVSTFDTIKSVLSWPKAHLPLLKNHAYLSVTPRVLNDVNVREGNVKNRDTRNQD